LRSPDPLVQLVPQARLEARLALMEVLVLLGQRVLWDNQALREHQEFKVVLEQLVPLDHLDPQLVGLELLVQQGCLVHQVLQVLQVLAVQMALRAPRGQRVRQV